MAQRSLGATIGALRFLYRVTLKRDWSDEDFPLPRKPVRLPVILSLEEITTFFESIASLKHRTILMTAYAAGLRVSEVVHLKVTDIDSRRMVIRVSQGKNHKDRYVMLSPRLLEILANVLARCSPAGLAVSRQHSRTAHQPRCRGPRHASLHVSVAASLQLPTSF
ncbi:tyrosine-type recombinase/integrase [Paraburkholderia humisilvae]|uniref:tyrosine-type recombinase/integrase n=1 Tax=Paraburkholderia humisilvae TaxID=627669 RepID=UPI001FE83BDF|nr:tyrosine-type recombinase/integrase [Paraburkholderia humisilvae]